MRLNKPGFLGVCSLIKETTYKINQNLHEITFSGKKELETFKWVGICFTSMHFRVGSVILEKKSVYKSRLFFMKMFGCQGQCVSTIINYST